MRTRYCLALAVLLLLSLLGGCGGSSDKPLTQEQMLEHTAKSQFGKAYEEFPYFSARKWAVVEVPEHGTFVEFQGSYDMQAILGAVCLEKLQNKGANETADILRIQGMLHRALFNVTLAEVTPIYSDWSILCDDGRQMMNPDEEFFSIREVMSATWTSSCEDMRKVAMQACPTPEEQEAAARAEQQPAAEGSAPASDTAAAPAETPEAAQEATPDAAQPAEAPAQQPAEQPAEQPAAAPAQ